jgi:ankyrin repeat protein
MCCFGPDEKERQKIKDDELLDAAQSGDVKIARKQLETGAFRNCKESMVRHALRVMSPGAARRHARCSQAMFQHRYWASCAFRACAPAAEALIALLAVHAIHAQYGSTPLHLAASFGHLNVVQLLCDYGADKEAKNKARRGARGTSHALTCCVRAGRPCEDVSGWG